jgi:tetratricopeptide (TPR) repeat protein/tRNA A-37 threonylcarbamoyl transferase component Bud32
MDAVTWARTKPLIADVLERPEAERDSFLERACDDPALRVAVRTLLKEYSPIFLTNTLTADQSFVTSDIDPQADALHPGAFVGPYEVIELLGTGGMSQVYLAQDRRLKRRVALKCLLSSKQATEERRARILQEARAAARITHNKVAAIYDVIEEADRVFIVMEYVEGESLARCIKRGPLPVDQVVAIGRQLAEALGAAHDQGVVHRDLKPANVQLTRDGSAKVLDFGVAQAVSIRSTSRAFDTTTLRTGAEVRPAAGGTPAYMSPEQVLGHPVDRRSDIFSLGVVLFEMATGRRPYTADNPLQLVTTFGRPIRRADEIDPRLPRGLGDVIAKALEVNRESRFESASALDAALVAFQRTLDRPRWAKARRARLLVVAAAVVIAALAVFTSLRKREGANWSAAPIARPVLAVLPLENLSGDPAKQYLGAGVAETLAMALSKIHQLTVVSSAEVQTAVRTGREPRKLARVLGASFLVDGSVQQAGDRLRLTLRLVRPDGSVEWSEAFDDSVSAVFKLQEAMAAALVRGVEQTTGVRQRQDPTIPSTTSVDALTTYWQGRSMLSSAASPPQIAEAVATFERVVAFDPGYALGYAGLAEALWAQYLESHDQAFARRGLQAGLQALHLDADQPAVRVAVATIYEGMGQLDDAIESLNTTLALQPNNADAHRILGRVYESRARWDDAIRELQASIAARPSWENYRDLGNLYFRLQRLSDAEDMFKRTLDIDPNDSRSYVNLGALYASIPNNERALEYFKRANQIQPQRRGYANIATISYRLGRFQEAIAAYKEALQLDPKSDITHGNLGDAYLRLGQRADAEREYRIARELSLDALRVNRRDAEILARVAAFEAKLGLSEDADSHIAQAQAIARDDVQILYKRAVVEAQLGRANQAIEELTRALELGYSARNAAEDYDLVSLRSFERFRSVVNRR